MKDPMFWLALVMALVPFIEQAAADPFVTSKPWLAAILGGAAMIARVAYLKYHPTVKVPVPVDAPKTVTVNPDKSVVTVK
jgi:hypothetical protein